MKIILDADRGWYALLEAVLLLWIPVSAWMETHWLTVILLILALAGVIVLTYGEEEVEE